MPIICTGTYASSAVLCTVELALRMVRIIETLEYLVLSGQPLILTKKEEEYSRN